MPAPAAAGSNNYDFESLLLSNNSPFYIVKEYNDAREFHTQ